MANIAVVGLGNMGAPMAAHLVQAQHDVSGYDPSTEASERARSHGVRIASDVTDAVGRAEIVLTMLPDGGVVEEVLTGSRGVLAALPSGGLVIDSSTIDVGTARRMHGAAAAAGHRYLDAPVSGGMTGAQAGTLTFMVGGDPGVLAEAEPALLAMGARAVHAGGPGAGAAAKIVNNMLLGISLTGVCEAFTLADRLGLDAAVFYDIATTSTGDCWALRNWTPVPDLVASAPASNDFRPGFSTDLMLKDLRLACEAADSVGAPLDTARTVRALFTDHAERGAGPRDCSSLIELVGQER